MESVRKFKIGDWVELKEDFKSPSWQVMKYIKEGFVECACYQNGQRYRKVFHEKLLIKPLRLPDL